LKLSNYKFTKFQNYQNNLWTLAELLVIEQFNPVYLVNAWHVSPSEKFDFNELDKLKLKALQSVKRIQPSKYQNPNKIQN
jgi:hypothetical protein